MIFYALFIRFLFTNFSIPTLQLYILFLQLFIFYQDFFSQCHLFPQMNLVHARDLYFMLLKALNASVEPHILILSQDFSP